MRHTRRAKTRWAGWKAAIVLSLLPYNLPAAADTRVQPRFMLGGFFDLARTEPHVFRAHPSPWALPRAKPGARKNEDAARAIKAYIERYPETLAMMMIDRGEIAHVAYNGAGGDDRPLYSMSIAKSLTSLAVGQALCAGLIPSVDTRVSATVPELAINNFGRSTIGDLLTMRSGAYVSAVVGQPKFRGGIGKRPRTGKPYRSYGWPIRLGQVTVADVLWGNGWHRIENADVHPPGQVFGYKGGDTLAVATAVARAAGKSLAGYFDETVWQKVRGGGPGKWEADREGRTVASSGAQFRLADWGRIAQWTLEQRQAQDCFGRYVRAATSTQTATLSPEGKPHPHFRGYGYQWWTENRYAPGFWAVGYAGQYIGIDPATRKILIKFGYARYGRAARDLFDLFAAWATPVSPLKGKLP